MSDVAAFNESSALPPPPYTKYPMPMTKSEWAAFTDPSSPTHGKLRFTIDNTTFSHWTSDYSGMYMRGYMAYLDGPVRDDTQTYKFKMVPTAGMQHQYRTWDQSGKPATWLADFEASPSLETAF